MEKREKPVRVMIGVPTIDSAGYIYGSMMRLYEQMVSCPSSFAIRWVICVNGPEQNDTFDEVQRLKSALPELDIVSLRLPRAGRNRALNHMLTYARAQHRSDIVCFVDDDVVLSEGTLCRNIRTLVEYEREMGLPLLVGAALRVKERALAECVRTYGLGWEALKRWCVHRIVAAPYLSHVEAPGFCEGFCFAAYTKYMFDYPDDETGITDDTFQSNAFAVRAKTQGYSLPATCKPESSVGWMEVSTELEEWRKQQLRIHAGILRSFMHFSRERRYLETLYAWPFAFNPGSRTPLKGHTLGQRLFAYVYLWLHRQNYRAAESLVQNDELPDWGTALGTKPQFPTTSR